MALSYGGYSRAHRGYSSNHEKEVARLRTTSLVIAQLPRLKAGRRLLKNIQRPNPVPRDSRPASPRVGSRLAVAGSFSTGRFSTAAGGVSTTCASSTVSPVGATASTGAVFRASTGVTARSAVVARTGSCVILASSMALDLGYTNSWPQFAPG